MNDRSGGSKPDSGRLKWIPGKLTWEDTWVMARKRKRHC